MVQYYIDISGRKDGPHDLVTLMRRIRAHKIGPDTGIFTDDNAIPIPASQLPDTAIFFTHNAQTSEPAAIRHSVIPALKARNLLRESWRFTTTNSIMTVFAGGMLLLGILVATGMINVLGTLPGGMLSWVIFMMMQYIYFICSLRMYRGQPFSARFWNEQLSPILFLLLFAAIVIGLMMTGGFILLIVPSIVVAVYYAFVPFLIMDRNMSLIEAMTASRLLVQKHRGRYQLGLALLMILHAICLFLIIPIPLTLPMFAACLARFYEELSSS